VVLSDVGARQLLIMHREGGPRPRNATRPERKSCRSPNVRTCTWALELEAGVCPQRSCSPSHARPRSTPLWHGPPGMCNDERRPTGPPVRSPAVHRLGPLARDSLRSSTAAQARPAVRAGTVRWPASTVGLGAGPVLELFGGVSAEAGEHGSRFTFRGDSVAIDDRLEEDVVGGGDIFG
jgi:hypothetical protein